jgi:hypothetical protein
MNSFHCAALILGLIAFLLLIPRQPKPAPAPTHVADPEQIIENDLLVPGEFVANHPTK